jgi:hypothetical protein
MAKDYFQDIVPPEEEGHGSRRKGSRRLNVTPPSSSEDENSDDMDVGLPIHAESEGSASGPSRGRSIRDIAPSRTRIRLSGEAHDPFTEDPDRRAFLNSRRWGLWVVAVLAVLIVGAFGLFAFRSTTVTVTPRMQAVTFDETSHFTAYPETTAASGTLPYKVISSDLDDSEPVEAQGMQHVETKASGSITVYNAYSSSPVRLIKDTRFESPDGLIYRTPAAVLIPGMKSGVPGSVSVTVVADQAGDQYNIAPARFTVPGLKSSAAMYAGVYAKSSEQLSGGFIGDQPAVAPATLTATISAVRARLAASALSSAASNADYIQFPDLMQITYQDMPSTTEAGGGVRIHEKAHIEMIAFPKDAFTHAVSASVSADAGNAPITLHQGTGFAAHTSLSPESWGSQPLDFVLAGQAQLVWDVDTEALGVALAGRDESAFQTIISSFPGIKEAHARIQPFWKSVFPNPSKIKITVVDPTVSN